MPVKSPSVAKAALLFGSGTLTSRILGLIRDAMITAIMPLHMRDAWIAAFRVPNLFRRLLGEGGLSMSFIPQYVATLRKGEPDTIKALVNGVFTLLMSLASLICVMAFVFMEPLMESLLSGKGFAEVVGKTAMTVTMARIMIFFFFFITLFAYYMALLNGRKKFTLTGYAPMLLNVAIIASLWLFRDSPHLVVASAWGVLIGGLLQALILLPAVISSGGGPRLTIHIFNPEVMKVLKRFAPTMLGMGVLQILNLINVYFASQLEPGALSFIYIADRLLELPLSLIAVSIGTTLLPSLSSFWDEKNLDQFSKILVRHVKLFFFLAIPSTVGLWFLGGTISDVLFARGEFTPDQVVVVAGILKVYCVTLLAAGGLKIFNQAFYAVGDPVTPAIVAAGGLVIHLLLAPVLMDRYQINGLVASTAIITCLNLFVCLILLQIKVTRLAWGSMAWHFVRCFAAASVMGGCLVFANSFQWRQNRFIFDFPSLLTIIAAGALVYFVVAALLRVDELSVLKRRLRR